MTLRSWHMRLSATYEGPANKVKTLRSEQMGEGGAWKPLAITADSPGFLIFVYSLLTCQHLYMHTNAAERGLVLESASGVLELTSTQDWMLVDLKVQFSGRLASGVPDPQAVADIERRMNQCPVSRNIHPSGIHESRLLLA